MRQIGAWLVIGFLVPACGDVKDAAPDAGATPDAVVDAAPVSVKFDIGYIDAITITPSITEVSSVIAVINTSAAPLDLSTAKVIAFVDDNSSARMSFQKVEGSAVMLAAGRAGGRLSAAAKAKILVDGVIQEPLDDQTLNFSIAFETPPSLGTIVTAQAVLAIGDATIVLPFVLTTDDGVDIQLTHANRLSSDI
jgi:hypothetical protein